MASLTGAQYDALERAIIEARRIAVVRRGTEYVVIPERLVVRGGQEVLVTRHPTTGAPLELRLIDCDLIEVVR